MKTIQEINKMLHSNGIFAEVESFPFDGVLITIEWGDWKHDHLYCARLMEKIGYEKLTTNITEQDGSDCYSCNHLFCPKDGVLKKLGELNNYEI